jgi:hypothetical protein
MGVGKRIERKGVREALQGKRGFYTEGAEIATGIERRKSRRMVGEKC